MLIGKEGQNFYRIIQNLEKVSPVRKELYCSNLMKEKKENQNYLSEMNCYGFFIFQIDSSLNLQIIRSDISIYNGIILWSKENVDEEKFKKAISVVSIFYGVKF